MARGWRVTSQVHDQVIPTDAGQAVTGSYVYFVTNNGNQASVFVPDATFSVEQVKRQVKDRAKLVDDIGELQEGQPQRG